MSVQYVSFPSVRISEQSVFRYLGIRGTPPAELSATVSQMISQAMQEASFRVCWLTVNTEISDETIRFGSFPAVKSEALARNLQWTRSAVIFCATCGVWFDRKIAAAKTSPSIAVLWDAVGTAAIEQLCDDFCAQQRTVRPRFSPGYGDLPLDFQKQLLGWLNASSLLGVGLTDSLLMTPTKSVTAIAAQEQV